jgi:sugar O-acyltransferase (sialic acid O-acetyltransferase NeuD family)
VRVATRPPLHVFAVASRYAWDVVESAVRAGFEPTAIDNFGEADPLLPGLRGPAASTDGGVDFVLGLSSADERALAAQAAYDLGRAQPIALRDPTATVASTSELAHGAYLNAGVVVASNTRIGCFANVNRSASVGHDNVLGFASSIGPGAVLAGEITVGAIAFVGAGATVLPGRTIGRRAIVGAGAVVTRDVADGEVVVGNPARVLRRIELTTEEDRCPHCSAL